MDYFTVPLLLLPPLPPLYPHTPRIPPAHHRPQNLRRWEVAERQRRKAARESVSVSASSTASAASPLARAPSLFADLFHRDARKAPRAGPGAHRVLDDADADDGMPLEELDTPTAREHARGDGSGGGHPHARGREGNEEGSEAAEIVSIQLRMRAALTRADPGKGRSGSIALTFV